MMGTDFYQVLEINRDAEQIQIKQAYFKKVRQHSPEREPEMFRLVREAYETLSNEKMKAEYDAFSTYGEEIQFLIESGQALMEKGEFRKAGKAFKKVLMIEPTLERPRNYYALSLAYDQEYDKAYKQFEHLMKESPENATYQYNYGSTLISAGRLEEGIKYLYRARQLDSSDINIFQSIIDAYVKNKQYAEAQQAIEKELKHLNEEDHSTVVYIFMLLEVHIVSNNQQAIDRSLAKIDEWTLQHSDRKDTVTRELTSLAIRLSNAKRYEMAERLINKAAQISPTHEFVLEIQQEISNKAPIFKEMAELEEDRQIADAIKNILILYLHGNEVDEDEFDQYSKKFFQELEFMCMYKPHAIIQSIKTMVIHYPHLYKVRKEVFQHSLKLAKKYNQINQQYDRMKEDSQITNGIKRLVALYLAEISQEERDTYFDDIMDEIGYTNRHEVYQSIRQIETSYPALYDLNADFFEKLKGMSLT